MFFTTLSFVRLMNSKPCAHGINALNTHTNKKILITSFVLYYTSMKKLISQKILEYTAIFEPADEGGYTASIPALPGCVSEGDTFEEAVAMIKDAMEGYLAVMKEEGKEIPEEKSDIIITKVTVDNPSSYTGV